MSSNVTYSKCSNVGSLWRGKRGQGKVIKLAKTLCSCRKHHCIGEGLHWLDVNSVRDVSVAPRVKWKHAISRSSYSARLQHNTIRPGLFAAVAGLNVTFFIIHKFPDQNLSISEKELNRCDRDAGSHGEEEKRRGRETPMFTSGSWPFDNDV